MCFTVAEEQVKDPETEDPGDDADEAEDEGIEDSPEESSEDAALYALSLNHAAITDEEQVSEEARPALEDVLMGPRRLHLPGFEQVEVLASLLIKVADLTDRHLVPVTLRNQIVKAVSALHNHDKSAVSFVKAYESRWGYTLFGRCLGPDSAQNSGAQKTKFGMRYAQAAQITEESRLLYLTIKMLKNRPPASDLTSPRKVVTAIRQGYATLMDRVHDDPVLSTLSMPLPNINAKSISVFLTKQEKKANLVATALPKSKSHKRVVSEEPLPKAPTLPSSLPTPLHEQVLYDVQPHAAGKRRGAKRRLDEELDPVPLLEEPSTSTSCHTKIAPKPAPPILVVVPAQPQAMSITPTLSGDFTTVQPPRPIPTRPALPNKSKKPCSQCQVPNCGGNRKRYTPNRTSDDQPIKIYTYCGISHRSPTPGFDGVYATFEEFKRAVDASLQSV